MDLVHRIGNCSVYFLSWAEGVTNLVPVVQWLKLALYEGPSRVGVSLSSQGDGRRFRFRDAVFSNYLEFRTMGKCIIPVILNDMHHYQNPLGSKMLEVSVTSAISLISWRRENLTVFDFNSSWKCHKNVNHTGTWEQFLLYVETQKWSRNCHWK
jgi:hypothetical protein